MKFSQRSGWPLVQNRMAQTLEYKKKSGTPILDLTESNPTRCEFQYLNAGLLEPFSDPRNLVYEPDPHGLLGARKQIVDYYSEKEISLHPDQIFLTASTSESYSLLFRLLCNAGDQVFFPNPSYPLLHYLSDLGDIQPLHYDLAYNDGWCMHRETFPKHLFKTKAFVVVHPNNPTGSFVTGEDGFFIRQTCQRASCAMIADEVFLDYPWNETIQAKSFAACSEVLSFALGGISKLLGLPQMKLGWIVVNGPREEKEEAIHRLEVIADTYLSVNSPVQNALSVWFQNHRPITQEIRGRCLQNLAFLRQALEKNTAIRLMEGQGGWYAMLGLMGSVSEEPFVHRLLEERHVFVYPGYYFHSSDSHSQYSGKYLVLSLLLPPLVFQQGIAHILKCT